MKQLESYTYTVPANGSVQIPAPNDNFYVMAATGPLSVRGDTFGRLRGMVAGQGLKGVEFNRLELIDESGAPNTVTILLTPAEFVNQVFSGSVAVVGSIPLTAATIADLKTPLAPNGFLSATGALAANTPVTLVTPAANVNGVVLLYANCNDLNATVIDMTFLHKASAPTSIYDGTPLVASDIVAMTGTSYAMAGRLETPAFVPAGQGVYFIAGSATSALNRRHARWRVL